MKSVMEKSGVVGAPSDRPKESGVPKALKRTAAAAKQFQINPTMHSGALGPVFLG